MKIRTLIIDDEPIALGKLRSYVAKVPFLELAGECNSGLDAIAMLSSREIDAVFTDINMPDLNGLDMVASLTRPPMIVFITAYPQYAVDSYRLSAVDYLLKPYSFADFQRAANKLMEQFSLRQSDGQRVQPQSNSIFVKVDYRFVRVELSSIRYIKGYGEYLQIFIKDSHNPLTTLSSFSSIARRLTGNFLQVHRSYIVNMDTVQQIGRSRMIIDSETEIPIGDSFKNAVQGYLEANSVGAPRKG